MKRARWLAVVALLLALAVAAIAARSSSTRPFTATATAAQNSSAIRSSTQADITAIGSGVNTEPTRHNASNTDWKRLVGLLAVVALVGWAMWRISTAEWSPWRGTAPPKHAGLPAYADDSASAQLQAAVDEGLESLARGPVSDAIIACWLRVERAAAGVGVEVRATETSAEFVDRVLNTYGASDRSIRRLAALYREARFSSHTMDERSRAEARAALIDVQRDLAGHRAAT